MRASINTKHIVAILILFLTCTTVFSACGLSNASISPSPSLISSLMPSSTLLLSSSPTLAPSPSIKLSTPTSKPVEKTISPLAALEAEKLYDKGFEVYLSGKYDEAIKQYNMALELDPNSYKALNGKGIALCFKGNYKEGMELISKALQIKPDFTYANFNMALAYKLQKDFTKALEWFNKAISYDPKDTWSYFGIACIYAEWNDAAKAIDYLRKAIEIDPEVKEAARNEHDLDNIKSNPEYIKLVK